MADHIHLKAQIFNDADVSVGDVRAALSELSDDDVSESSPVSGGVPEAGIEVNEGSVDVRIEGHAGEFTKTSQRALVGVLEEIEGGQNTVEIIDGGYEKDG